MRRITLGVLVLVLSVAAVPAVAGDRGADPYLDSFNHSARATFANAERSVGVEVGLYEFAYRDLEEGFVVNMAVYDLPAPYLSCYGYTRLDGVESYGFRVGRTHVSADIPLRCFDGATGTT